MSSMAFSEEVISQSLLDSVKFPPSRAARLGLGGELKRTSALGWKNLVILGLTLRNQTVRTFNRLRKKLKSTRKKACAKPTSRFGAPTTSEQLEKLSKGVVPKNTQTQKNDTWAQKIFVDWLNARNCSCPEDLCPQDILFTHDAALLDKWLSLFTIAVRRKDGSEYPSATIHMLLYGLQRIMRRESEHPFEIFAQGDMHAFS